MTTEAQRIAIATACGWKGIDRRRWGGYTEDYQPLCSPSDALGAPAKYWGYIPDYLNDLNAAHEMEKALPDGHTYWRFISILDDIVKHGPHVDYVADRASATASQRAEAFLRTLNLLKE